VSGPWVGFAVSHSCLLDILHVKITSQQMVTFMLAVFTVTNLSQICLSPHPIFPPTSTYSTAVKNDASEYDPCLVMLVANCTIS